jgi:hypothetical protein
MPLAAKREKSHRRKRHEESGGRRTKIGNLENGT